VKLETLEEIAEEALRGNLDKFKIKQEIEEITTRI
jgi:hypothetical protein